MCTKCALGCPLWLCLAVKTKHLLEHCASIGWTFAMVFVEKIFIRNDPFSCHISSPHKAYTVRLQFRYQNTTKPTTTIQSTSIYLIQELHNINTRETRQPSDSETMLMSSHFGVYTDIIFPERQQAWNNISAAESNAFWFDAYRFRFHLDTLCCFGFTIFTRMILSMSIATGCWKGPQRVGELRECDDEIDSLQSPCLWLNTRLTHPHISKRQRDTDV